MGFIALGLSNFANAGESFIPYDDTPVIEEPQHVGGWCDALQSIGKLYKNSENPLVQEFSVFGRFQYQGAYIDGEDVNGDNFNESVDEIRRARIGAKAKFLNYFDIAANINLFSDSRRSGGDLDFGFQSFDTAVIGFDIKKAFGIDQLDKLHVSYGRQKFSLSHEANLSSKKISTVERSAISNRVFGSFRPTGLKVRAEKAQWDFLLGIYSTDDEDTFIADWNESIAWQGSIGYQATDQLHVLADFVYNDDDEQNTFEYEWAASLSAAYDAGRWGVATDLIYGNNGDEGNGEINAERQGNFWGVVILPHYWLVKDRLQAVARYQYQGSEQSEGIRLNSRYSGRDNVVDADVNDGRGDSHHSYYLGLNYHLCDHNAKILAGIEYDDLETPNGDVDAITYWLAFRTYF